MADYGIVDRTEEGSLGRITVGFNDVQSGFGSITLDAGDDLSLTSADPNSDPSLKLGQEGGTGILLVDGIGTSVEIVSTGAMGEENGANVAVGSDYGTGTLVVQNQALFRISDPNGSVGLNGQGSDGMGIGARPGSTGAVTINHGSTFEIDAGGAYMNVGRRGGFGSFDVLNGSTATLSSNPQSGNGGVFVQIGRDGGKGRVTVDDSTLTLISYDQFAPSITVGLKSSADARETDGSLTVTSGGTLILESAVSNTQSNPVLHIGRIGGAQSTAEIASDLTGRVVVSDGGKIRFVDADGANKGFATVGSSNGVGRSALTITGAASQITGLSDIIIGANPWQLNEANSIGNGIVSVDSGGLLQSQYVSLGKGGVLKGDGTVQAEVNMRGGTLIAGAIGNTLTIDGMLNFDAGAMRFGVRGLADSDRVQVENSNSLVWEPGVASYQGGAFKIVAEEGFKFAKGNKIDLVTAATDVYFKKSGVVNSAGTSATGQHQDFGFVVYGEGSTIKFQALNSGSSGGIAAFDLGAASTHAATVTYSTTSLDGYGRGGFFNAFVLKNIDSILGTAAGDKITVVGTRAFTIDGRGGADTLHGGSGADKISGGIGNDTISAGSGVDTLVGGTGRDTLSGGAHGDTFFFARGDSGITTATADTIKDWTIADSIDTSLRGTSANYMEYATTATTIEAAAKFAETKDTGAVDLIFLYNSSKKIGFVLMDLDDNEKFETGVILAGQGSAANFSYADLI